MRLHRAALSLAVLLAACGGSNSGGGIQPPPPPPPPPPSVIDHVTVDPVVVTLDVGSTRQLQVAAVDASGAAVSGATFTYTTSAPAIATISTLGNITALLPGSATITTTSGGKSATTAVTVRLAAVGNVTLTVSRTLIKESDTVRAVPVVRDEQNAVITRDLTWSSSDSSVALVTPLGLILGVSPGGPVTITATAGGKSGSVIIAVIPASVQQVKVKPDTADLIPGSTKQMTASAVDEFGNAVINRPITWSSINPTAATVDSTGLVRAVSVGESTILATVGGVTAQALVRVTLLALARFRIEVTNHLSYRVEILQNGVIVGNADAGGSTTIERPLTPTLTLSWRMPALFDRGESFGESYPPILNPTGAIPLVIDNVLNDGRIYFNPVLRNLSSAKVLADFPLRDNALPCNCSITTLGAPQEYGYWLWSPTAALRVYRVTDLLLQGVFLSFPIPLGELEARTGVWRFNLLVAP